MDDAHAAAAAAGRLIMTGSDCACDCENSRRIAPSGPSEPEAGYASAFMILMAIPCRPSGDRLALARENETALLPALRNRILGQESIAG